MLHRSYLVTWHGLRIYITGDTGVYAQLVRQTDLDVAFVTPWLVRELRKTGATVKADKVVVYHHKADEKKPPCETCLFPKQGDTFEIGYDF
jgi:hypothetical protein